MSTEEKSANPTGLVGTQTRRLFIVLGQQRDVIRDIIRKFSFTKLSKLNSYFPTFLKQTEYIYGMGRGILVDRLLLHWFVVKIDLKIFGV